jgi:lipopolysaccharide export system ATP-binding protein
MTKYKTLSACNLSKTYGKKKVITDVSFNVKQNEVVAILGPNGAGKTTSFYILVGLVLPNSGNVFLDNINITKIPIHQRAKLGISYLPQEMSIFRGLNVEQNIMAVLEIVERNIQIRKEKLEKLLSEFSIQHIRKSHALSLSGGERRRVEIARAIATNPAFILLDEPFAGVDPIAVADIRQMVLHLKDRGIGVLITDHNVRETLQVVDRAYIVYNGSILASGDKQTIINNETVKKVYLGNEFSI